MIWQGVRRKGHSALDSSKNQVGKGIFQSGGCCCRKGRGLRGGSVDMDQLEKQFKDIFTPTGRQTGSSFSTVPYLLPVKPELDTRGLTKIKKDTTKKKKGKGLFFEGVPLDQQDGSALFFDGIPPSRQDGSRYVKQRGKKKLSLSSSEAVRYGRGLKQF